MENPFIVTGKIKPEYFCDRAEEAQRLTRCILSGGENMVIIGDRRIGKTSLINYCFDKAEVKEQVTTLFVDILRTSSLQEFIYLLAHAVFNTFVSQSEHMMNICIKTMHSLRNFWGYDPNQGLPIFNVKLGDIINPQLTLEEIFKCIELADQRCIVAIDEFQQIANYPEENVEELLSQSIRQSTNANFIFTSCEQHFINELFLNPTRPFYQSASIMKLDVLNEDLYKDFVLTHFKNNQLSIFPEVLLLVNSVFFGNTYYMQKVFHEAFTTCLLGNTCDASLIESIIDDMVQERGHQYSQALARLTLPQKELLYAIAEDIYASRITSSQFIKRHRLLSASSVQAAIRKLLNYGLVINKRGCYMIEDSLFQQWIITQR